MELQSLIYGEDRIVFEVCFTSGRERKVAIHVRPDGAVQVDAPMGSGRAAIRKAVRKRARWVIGHLKKNREQRRHVLPRRYISGESHFYLGRRYVLKVFKDERRDHGVNVQRSRINIFTPDATAGAVKQLLYKWYRERAGKVFQGRLRALAPSARWLKGKLPTMKILEMKKQWGSCSPGGRILLNPHLVKAPGECIDYVILHELCHLRVHNHGPAFYSLLKTLMPQWKITKSKLDLMAEILLNQ